MLILLVGPTRVGKSTLGRKAGQALANCEFFDLDEVLARQTGERVTSLHLRLQDDGFFELSARAMKAIDASCASRVCLVAVGAGSLQSSQAGAWLRKHTTIAIVASPEELYKRDAFRKQRTFEQFVDSEYSQSRQSMYHGADHLLDVSGLHPDEASARFIALLQRCLGLSLRTAG